MPTLSAEDEVAVDEPVGLTEALAPAQPRSDELDGMRRWITADDVALLLAPGHLALPLAARLATHVDARDEHGWTVLMHATLRGLPAAVAELLEASADVGCQSTLLKRVEMRDQILEFPRGSTALSVANACLEDGCSEDSDSFVVLSMLRGPGRLAGAPAEDLSLARATEDARSRNFLAAGGTGLAGTAGPTEFSRGHDPRKDLPPLASAYSWLPASALPEHYRQTPTQSSESAEDASRREYREAVAESAVLRASGDFDRAVNGYRAAVQRYAGPALRDDQYVVREPPSASPGSFTIKRQSWDIANQQRTIEWRIS